MSAEKILGLSNSEDSMWYRLSPENDTLKKLDLNFDLYDNFYEESESNIYNYEFHTSSGEFYFHKECEGFVVYFIFTKHTAHVILRKVLAWQEYAEIIDQSFVF